MPNDPDAFSPGPFEPAPLTRPARQSQGSDPLTDINRALPYSDDAEKGLLSCFLQNPVDLLADAAESVNDDWFYHPVNRQIYRELLAMNAASRAVDIVTFSQWLIDRQLIDKIGGPSFLAELLSFVPTSAHYPYYKGIMRDKALLRRMIAVSTENIQRCYEVCDDVHGVLDRFEAAAMGVRPVEGVSQSDDWREGLAATLDKIQAQRARGEELPGYSTGLTWLDFTSGGLQRAMWVIAARPSDGKTALVLHILRELAVEQRLTCGFFSLDTSRDVLYRRMLSAQAWVPLTALLKGTLDAAEEKKLMDGYKRLWEANVLIDDRPGLTIGQVRAKARRWVKQKGVKVIALDFIQRMTGAGGYGGNRRDMHEENSSGLADLSKELGVPIVVLAQLNRDVEKRPKGQRPKISDIEGCGRIEQDADLICLLSRFKQQPQAVHQRHVLLDVAKNKDGPTDSAVHLFLGPFMRWNREPVII